MDSGIILFCLLLIAVGVALIAFVRSEFVRRERDGDEDQTIRQQTARTLRQMERQRGRIWWKMDEAYAEFVKKAAIESPPTRLLPDKVMPQANTGQLAVRGEEDFALTELQTAYELFLGKDSRQTAGANYAATPGKPFGPTAG